MTYARKFAAALSAGACIVAIAAPASAQTRDYNISSGNLKSALDAYARQSGRQIIYKVDEVRSAHSPGARGALSADAALNALLADTGFGFRGDASGAIAIVQTGETGAGSAAADNESARAAENAKIIVVGSRLGARSPAESVLPIKVITRQDIDRSGATSIAQALSYLPEVSVNNNGDTNIGATPGIGGSSNAIDATTVQLRGLPAGTTLILINGHRAGESSAFQSSGQFDLSTIPLAMVERIEILPSGASAIYGGDALAGVVNIVLRRDASGFEVRGQRMMAKGYAENEASILWGHSWSGAQITLGANWRRTGALTTAERPLTANEDYRRFGGYDYRSTGIGYPGNVYSLAGCPPAPNFCFVPISQRGNLPGVNAPYAAIPAGQNGQNLTPGAFAQTAGTLNSSSSVYNLFSPGTTWGLNFSGSIDLASNVELFSEASFSRRTIPASQAALSVQLGQYHLASATVPANNPYNPFGVDVGVSLVFRDTGVLTDFNQESWRALVGARGKVGRFNWEVTGVQSQDHGRVVRGSNAFDSAAITAALQSTNPATALNPFVGDGTAPYSSQLLASLLLPADTIDYTSKLTDITATIRGPLLHLPAGDVLAVVGGEYQRQYARSDAGLSDGASDSSRAAFAEIRLPIWKRAADQRERLAATAAWRRETSDRYEGASNTETFGLEFRPVQSLLLRSTYSSAFKPLVIYNALRPESEFPSGALDPKFNNQFFPVTFTAGGGVPAGLKPETSVSRTAGAVWSPSRAFRASVTWWDNNLKNRFTIPDPDFLLQYESLFPTRVIRDSVTGFLSTIDLRPINIAKTHVTGVDMAVDGRISTPFGDFIPSVAATYTIRHREQVLPTSPVQNNLGVYRSTGWSPRWKIVPRLGWDHKSIFYLNLMGRYVSSYQDPDPLPEGPNAGTLQRLGDFWLIDLNAELNVGRWLAPKSPLVAGTRLSFGVNNLFDKGPAFCNSCGEIGYDANQYDILGRRFNLALRFSF